jgi:hypothetical protein
VSQVIVDIQAAITNVLKTNKWITADSQVTVRFVDTMYSPARLVSELGLSQIVSFPTQLGLIVLVNNPKLPKESTIEVLNIGL